jgi:DNA-binding transcriptional regulator YbjK
MIRLAARNPVSRNATAGGHETAAAWLARCDLRTTIEILACEGMRGLTHRAVDRKAGLPPGTTSNYASTRAALLELSLARMTELESAAFAQVVVPPTTPEELAEAVAGAVHLSVTIARVRMVARFELALEATRRPELRTAYDTVGFRIREMTESLLTSLGSTDPRRHAYAIVSWAEGKTFYALAGSGHDRVPSLDQLREEATWFVRALPHS